MAFFEKRFRVFAGPNGSGKTTIIRKIQKLVLNGRPIDWGTYINADQVGAEIRNKSFSFSHYELQPFLEEFLAFSISSGLLPSESEFSTFKNSFSWNNGNLRMLKKEDLLPSSYTDLVAQLLALFIVDCFLNLGRKLSFETVFSHNSKVDLLEFAKTKGYKVYLYFICTNDPEINVMRVANRVIEGGHGVTSEKVRSRYWRSLENLGAACNFSYQAFFFDNSGYRDEYKKVGHFKEVAGFREWAPMHEKDIPEWFLVNCLEKFPESQAAILPA